MGSAYLSMLGFLRAILLVLCALSILPELTHAKHARVTRHYKFNVCLLHFIAMFLRQRYAFYFAGMNLPLMIKMFSHFLLCRSKCKMSQDFAKQRAL